ncbi:MAG: MFS transporter [Candidatus Thermoplasmatota archaeon]|nr:MFS transporter [Candidatus Thermoplasmatota archaeon]
MRNVGVASAVSGMRGLAFSSLWIFSALYLRSYLGLSVVTDAVIITSGTAIGAIVQKFAGSLGDHFGHKRTVILAVFVSTLLYLLLFISSPVRQYSPYFIVTFMALTISNSSQMPSIYALVSESSEIKTKGFSILRVGNNIGWGIGPAIGGFAIYYSGFFYLFVFGFISSAVSLVIALFLKEVKFSRAIHKGFRTDNRLLIALSVSALLLFMVQSQETVTLTNYANILRGLNYFELGLIYLVNGIGVVVTQGPIYKVVKRIGNYASFSVGTLIYTAGFFSYAFDNSLTGMLISTLILTIGEDLAFPSGSAMVSLVSKPENIGRNMGIFNGFISIGRALGPLLGGVALFITTVPVLIWGITTSTGFASMIFFIFVFRNVSRIQENMKREGS